MPEVWRAAAARRASFLPVMTVRVPAAAKALAAARPMPAPAPVMSAIRGVVACMKISNEKEGACPPGNSRGGLRSVERLGGDGGAHADGHPVPGIDGGDRP